MRLEYNQNTNETEKEEYIIPPKEDSLENKKRTKETFKSLDTKGKIRFIWDYYKWFFIIGVAVVIAASVFVRDYIENSKPTYLYAEIINSNFGYDSTNTLEQDYVDQYGIDVDANHVFIDFSVNLSQEAFDSMMIASQTKLVSLYQAGELDVMMGPVGIMEGPANCYGYADLTEVLPQDLLDELTDRDYEFYYYDHAKVLEEQAKEDDYTVDPKDIAEAPAPYVAGIYLDNCSYLNNNGEYGCYDVATEEENRPIFTVCNNAPHVDHAIEFLRFLIENR